MKTINMELTIKGQALNAKIKLGKGTVPLEFTRVVTASGYSDDPHSLDDVVDKRQNVAIIARRVIGIRTAITVLLTNQGNPGVGESPLSEGYELRQFGLFTIDPDEGEILYRISQFERPNYMPAAREAAVTSEHTWNFVTENARDVAVEVDQSGFATMGQLSDHIGQLVMSPGGVHGIRFHDRTLQLWDGEKWVPILQVPSLGGWQWLVDDGTLSNTVPFGDANKGVLSFMDGFAGVNGSVLVMKPN